MKHTVTELLIYQLKPRSIQQKSFMIHEVSQCMNRFPGFVARKVHQSLNQEGLWMDVVQWQSLAHAKQAAQQLQKTPVFEKFVSSIHDILIFEYLQSEYQYQVIPKRPQASTKVVEVAMYKAPRAYRPNPREVHVWKDRKLRMMDGCISRQTYSACQENNLFFDYILWENWEQANRAKRTEASRQRILNFFGSSSQNLIAEHFKLLN